MDKAILIPANPKRQFMGGQQEGSIEAHSEKILQCGAVFWRLVAPGDWVAAEFPHAEIRKGYLYDVSIRKVTHVCDISWIRPMSELSYEDSHMYFLEAFESQEHFQDVSELFYVLNITAISQLEQPLALSQFRKHRNGEPVKLVRNYCIVQNPESGEAETISAISAGFSDSETRMGNMKINVIRTDRTEGKMGHGVIFYYEISGPENRLPVAFLDEYRWLHGTPESVDVLLFDLDPALVAQTGVDGDQIVAAVMDFLKEFIRNKGVDKSRGCVTTWWNA